MNNKPIRGFFHEFQLPAGTLVVGSIKRAEEYSYNMAAHTGRWSGQIPNYGKRYVPPIDEPQEREPIERSREDQEADDAGQRRWGEL